MINILFFAMCLVTSSTSHEVDSMQTTLKEDLELESQLKLINKPPIKSIHTKFGYIVDCIDINKQPAFDHPLLKNHKLQRKPSFQKTSVKNSPAKPIFVGLEKDRCPLGTVPIRRTTNDDLIRAKSLLNNHILTIGNPGSHVAEVTLETYPNMPYYGVGGINSIYNPRVEKDQTSASHIWVQNGQEDDTNKIVAGWHVSPPLYGDDATYIYSFWTSDSHRKTGCYNLLCQGFVQTDKETYIGARVGDISVLGGLMTELPLSILQDPVTKHWWLKMDDKNIGYFPADLFSNLATANQVGWGGMTTTPTGSSSPQMGSGLFPDDNFVHACYFSEVTYRNASILDNGPEKYMVNTFTDRPSCFRVKYYGDQGRQVGYSLQFGGPGGDCDD